MPWRWLGTSSLTNARAGDLSLEKGKYPIDYYSGSIQKLVLSIL